jgi:hypothetical protein
MFNDNKKCEEEVRSNVFTMVLIHCITPCHVVKNTKISEKFATSSFGVEKETSSRMSEIFAIQNSAIFRRFYIEFENNFTALSLVVGKKHRESKGNNLKSHLLR